MRYANIITVITAFSSQARTVQMRCGDVELDHQIGPALLQIFFVSGAHALYYFTLNQYGNVIRPDGFLRRYKSSSVQELYLPY